MSLTLFFAILSVGIIYLLYETFRKSREMPSKPTENLNSRLRVMHSHECNLLKGLQQAKKESIKTRTISIHLGSGQELNGQELNGQELNWQELNGQEFKSQEGNGQEGPSLEELENIRSVFVKLNRTVRLYLLEKVGQQGSRQMQVLKQVIGAEYVIPYQSAEGAVAVLRQLGAGLHLESSPELYLKIKQYLNKIWFVGTDQNQQALREFKNETEMLLFLGNLPNNEQ